MKKLFKPLKLVLVLSMFYLFVQCEHELKKENFIDIEEPLTNPQFDLSIVDQNDTIVLFNREEFVYDLETFGKEIYEARFELNGEEWGVYNKNGSFEINPNEYESGYYTLSLTLASSTGTGSMADILGTEGYIVTKQWVIFMYTEPPSDIGFSYQVLDNGDIKFTWNKCNQPNFSKYYLRIYENLENETRLSTYNQDCTSFIFRTFPGGRFRAHLTTEVKTINSNRINNIEEYFSPSQLQHEILNKDSIRLFWEKSIFNIKSCIRSGGITYSDFTTDTSIVLEHKGLGRHHFGRSDAHISNNNVNLESHWIPGSGTEYRIGEFNNLALTGMLYNVKEDLFFNNGHHWIYTIDFDSFEYVRKSFFPSIIYDLSTLTFNSSKFVYYIPDTLYICNNKELENPEKMYYYYHEKRNSYYPLTKLASENILVSIHINKMDLIDITNKIILDTISFDQSYYAFGGPNFEIDINGKYVCIYTDDLIDIYSIEGNTINRIYSNSSNPYTAAKFSYLNPETVYLSKENSNIIEVRNASTFSINHTISTNIPLRINNIDPITNNILMSNQSRVYVYDPIEDKFIFEINCENAYKAELINNRLTNDDQYYLNINDYLN